MGISIKLWCGAIVGLFKRKGSSMPSVGRCDTSSTPQSYLPIPVITMRQLVLLLLLKAGDVEENPGPNGHKTSKGHSSACKKKIKKLFKIYIYIYM